MQAEAPGRRSLAALCLAGAVLAFSAVLELRAEPQASLGAAALRPLPYSALAGWAEDDHEAAFRTFRRSCEAIAAGQPVLRPALATGDDLRAVCREALAAPAPNRDAARAFFEARFEPVEVAPSSGAGFLTGYFEPEVEGSLEPTDAFRAPLLARPDDLVSLAQGETLPGLDPGLQAARKTADGFEPYPDRAAIETGALGSRARPVAYVRDRVEAFIIQVQGSARLRLPDGGTARIAYAGRNGHPYTSIGRVLVESGRVPLAAMNLERLTGWLREHPDEADGVMRQNRSFVFFRLATEIDPADGPIGGAGVPLTPGRSLAVDRTLWSYGLPVWLEGALPRPDGPPEPLTRLMVAQDTGTAIVGPARGDFFFGSGPAAGTRAGLLRNPVRFVVLRPRS